MGTWKLSLTGQQFRESKTKTEMLKVIFMITLHTHASFSYIHSLIHPSMALFEQGLSQLV